MVATRPKSFRPAGVGSLALVILMGFVGLSAAAVERDVEIPEGCELCRILGEAYVSGAFLQEEWRLPEPYDLRSVLEFFDGQVDLAARAAAVVASSRVLDPQGEDIRVSASQVRGLLDSYGSGETTRRAD